MAKELGGKPDERERPHLFHRQSRHPTRRQALGLGSLLQCKGLMEIVAATILHAQGMLSDFAFASLMVLAVISTALTGPLFRLFAPRTGASDTAR